MLRDRTGFTERSKYMIQKLKHINVMRGVNLWIATLFLAVQFPLFLMMPSTAYANEEIEGESAPVVQEIQNVPEQVEEKKPETPPAVQEKKPETPQQDKQQDKPTQFQPQNPVPLNGPPAGEAGDKIPEKVKKEDTLKWGSQGKENADPKCERGQTSYWHWILTPGGNNDLVSAKLHVEYKDGKKTTTDGVFRGGGSGAMHFDVERSRPTAVKSAYVDFIYMSGQGGGNFILTISDSECRGEVEEKPGHITIVKQVVRGDNEQAFRFKGGTEKYPEKYRFTLDDNEDETYSDSKTFNRLNPGKYTFTEQGIENWRVADIVCNTERKISEDGRTVTFMLAANEHVTCTFKNRQAGGGGGDERGSITVVKRTDHRESPKFTFSTDLMRRDFKLRGGDQKVFENVRDGRYYVSEKDNVEGWSLDKIRCSGADDSKIRVNDNRVDIRLRSAENITCTFYNEKDKEYGSISGVKFEDVNNNSAYDSGLDNRVEGWKITLEKVRKNKPNIPMGYTTTATDGTFSFDDLKRGTYLVCEADRKGWTQTLPVTNDGCYEVKINKKNLHFNAALFGNFQLGGVGGVKFNDLNNSRSYDTGEPKLANWTITLKDYEGHVIDTQKTAADGTYAFSGLAAGTYYVCETQQDGWVRTLPMDSDCKKFTINESGQFVEVLFGNRERAPGQVLGDTTVTPVAVTTTVTPTGGAGAGEVLSLADTGSNIWASVFTGMAILGLAGAAGLISRKQYDS
jgi:hypothetical protein